MADHESKNAADTSSNDRMDRVDISSERTPPDGDSPPPPPARPSAKRWVHFDDATTANKSIDQSINQSSISDHRDDSELNRLPKPIVVPRRSNLHQENGTTSNNVDSGQTASDVAQISVIVEEAKMPGKSSTKQQRDGQTANVDETMQSNTDSSVRQFENGKIITEKKSENKHCAWVTIARFDPYRMPKSLISDQLTMPVEDYVTAMEMLTNDFRFRSYTVLYRRLIAGWLVSSLFILMIILLSGLKGLSLFGLTLFWLFLTCVGVFVCLFIKKLINKGLHNCVASVNKLLLRYNLLLGVEDRGKLSCHKIVIPFVYVNAKDCLPRIKQQLAHHGNSAGNVPTVTVDVDPSASVGHGRAATSDEKAEDVILKYSQSYVKALVRRTIRFPSRPSEGVTDEAPLHCTHSYCLCQYLRKYYFERTPRKWYHRFCLDSDLPAQESAGFTSTVVAYGYPPVVYG